MTDVRIEIAKDGPYRVTGPIELIDSHGNAVSVVEGRRVLLCRCGGSATKPFCDGTHHRIGFDATTAASRDDSAQPPSST